MVIAMLPESITKMILVEILGFGAKRQEEAGRRAIAEGQWSQRLCRGKRNFRREPCVKHKKSGKLI